MKIFFIDTNILLDIFLKRTKLYEASAQLFRYKDDEKCILHTSSSCILTALYFLQKEKLTSLEVKKHLRAMLHYCVIDDADENVFYAAASNDDFKDVEDAVLHYIAVKIKGIDGIVTRNTKDFKHSLIKVYTPEESLKFIENKSN
jgi:predicted nucleic acid-binding protein